MDGDINVVLLSAWQQQHKKELEEKDKQIDMLTELAYGKGIQVPIRILRDYVCGTWTNNHSFLEFMQANGGFYNAHEKIRAEMCELAKEGVDFLAWRLDAMRLRNEVEHLTTDLEFAQRESRALRALLYPNVIPHSPPKPEGPTFDCVAIDNPIVSLSSSENIVRCC